MTVQINRLDRSRHNILRFHRLAYHIYKGDPNWVAPLLIDRLVLFSNRNPFFEHAEMEMWVATKDGQDVGRIAAIIDHNYNKFHNDKAAYFGFFECVNDFSIARALFETTFKWAQARGAIHILGPMNPSTNEECGLLIEGFDGPPTFMMPYNPPYYPQLIESVGFQKARDLLAYYVDVKACPLDKISKIAERVKNKIPGLKLNLVTPKTLRNDMEKIKKVYNRAWEANWGFVPMTDAEMEFFARRAKPVFREGLVWYATINEEPVGFLLALPDFNLAFKCLKGRLLTPGVFKALPFIMGWKTPHRCRVLVLGVVKEYRQRGIETALLAEGFNAGIKAGITEAEASWILEDNIIMCRAMEFFGGKVYRKYRIYDRAI